MTLPRMYPPARVFNVEAGRPARLPATTAEAKRPTFSKPICWAPSARLMRAFVCRRVRICAERRGDVWAYSIVHGLILLKSRSVAARRAEVLDKETT